MPLSLTRNHSASWERPQSLLLLIWSIFWGTHLPHATATAATLDNYDQCIIKAAAAYMINIFGDTPTTCYCYCCYSWYQWSVHYQSCRWLYDQYFRGHTYHMLLLLLLLFLTPAAAFMMFNILGAAPIVCYHCTDIWCRILRILRLLLLIRW